MIRCTSYRAKDPDDKYFMINTDNKIYCITGYNLGETSRFFKADEILQVPNSLKNDIDKIFKWVAEEYELELIGDSFISRW
jgi:hypothetical protein